MDTYTQDSNSNDFGNICFLKLFVCFIGTPWGIIGEKKNSTHERPFRPQSPQPPQNFFLGGGGGGGGGGIARTEPRGGCAQDIAEGVADGSHRIPFLSVYHGEPLSEAGQRKTKISCFLHITSSEN